ncbi:MAG: hypothetical protein IT176_05185 [Acidobacteria bacterium]|nr:hypothetical protein [Acidobacteriota bacterium]
MRVALTASLAALLAAPWARSAARPVDEIRSIRAVPAHVAGRFRNPAGFQQSASGQYFVFDRGAHVVYGLDAQQQSSWAIVHIGFEEGRIIDPTAFSVEPGGTFAVADAPNNRRRIQIFSPAGFRIGGFLLPGGAPMRIVFDNVAVSGIGALQYTGESILISQPDTGALITEYALSGAVKRQIGRLRPTGHEDDPDVHVALNSGIPLVDPAGGYYFVFQTGVPMMRKYDEAGDLVFERVIQGREIDDLVARLPTTWRRPSNGPGRAPSTRQDRGASTGPARAEDELPLVGPTVRSAAVDAKGSLWVAFVVPYIYVFDRDGDKIRTLQFRGAGIVSPNSMFFGRDGRLLVTPGLYELRP